MSCGVTIKLLCDQKKGMYSIFILWWTIPLLFFQGRGSYFITQPELIVACHKKVKLSDIKAVHSLLIFFLVLEVEHFIALLTQL